MILDASAVMAVVLNEPGADMVMKSLDNATISAVSFAEAFTSMQSKGMTAETAEQVLHAMNMSVEPATEAHARSAARMWPRTKNAGLSLGDRFCLALALERDDEVLTADRAWASVAHGAKVTYIR